MKLFIWTDVLYDYTAGMAVAIGADLPAALRAMEKTDASAARLLGRPTRIIDLDKIKSPAAWTCWGGG